MDALSFETELSDDEIFYGKVSIKEVKKKLFLHDHRKTISFDKPFIEENKGTSDSFKIIEVHSEPEMTPRQNVFHLDTEVNDKHNSDPDISTRNSYSNWDVKSSEDSFLKIEKMVSKLCMSPERDELDNTLDIVDQILSSKKECKNVPVTKTIISNVTDVDSNEKIQIKTENNIKYELDTESDCISLSDNIKKEFCKEESNQIVTSSKEPDNKAVPQNNTIFKTPSTLRIKKYSHVQKVTPSSSLKSNHTPFKVNNLTPHHQNCITSKKTPHKTNAYQHITSPVASYIRQSPQVPLLKDVFPKKPIAGLSHIPKPVKNVDIKCSNKENVMLPPVAYKSAKKTQMINVPDKQKLPQSPWAKQVATTLPKPCVIRHDHRETNGLAKPVPSSHDSFADLSLHQADVSVCTQKSALNKL